MISVRFVYWQLFGIALIAVGAYVQSQLHEYLNFFDTNVNGPAILLIVVGLVIFVISFFGCCGAIKENYCMVLTVSEMLTSNVLRDVWSMNG